MPLQNGARTHPSPEAVRAELARICASAEFQKAKKLRDFLTLVVNLKLDGEAESIKAYTVGTLALGRKETFDPSKDAIVRVMATRLRRTLQLYYTRSGAADPIEISMTAGSYVPKFTAKDDASASSSGDAARSAIFSAEPAPGRELLACEVGSNLKSGPGEETAFERTASPSQTSHQRRLPDETTEVLASPAERSQRNGAHISLSAASSADAQLSSENDDGPGGGGRRIGLRTIIITACVFFAKVSLALAVISISTGLDGGAARSVGANDFATPLVVAVLDVEAPPGKPGLKTLGVELHDTLIRAMSRFEDVSVLAPAANKSAARFHIQGRLSDEENPVLSVRFIRWPAGEVVWTYAASVAETEARRNAVRLIATAIGRPSGLALKRVTRWNRSGGGKWESCRLAMETFLRRPDPTGYDEAKTCVEAAVADRDTANDAAHSRMLSFLGRVHIDGHRHGFASNENALHSALKAASRAAAIAPESAWAWQTLCDAKFHLGDIDEAMPACENALKMNPFDADIHAAVGARLIAKGEYDRGLALIERALLDNPAEPVWYKLWLFLGHWRKGDVEQAESCLHNVPDDLGVMGQIVRTIAAIQQRRPAEAQDAIARLKEQRPEIVSDPAGTLRRYFPKRDFADAVLAALNRAGLSSL